MAVSEAAAGVVDLIPRSTVETLAAALADCDGQAASVRAILARIPHTHHRAVASSFVDTWLADAPHLPPVAAAMCLLGAAESADRNGSHPTCELVWTGPPGGDTPVRRTEQALLQLLDDARERVMVVSFAVYRVPTVCRAMVTAAERGCRLRVVLETESRKGGTAAHGPLAALGQNVGKCSEVYAWRRGDPSGHRGAMHVKAAIADGERLLLSSANLTESALSTNMELGVLITGGRPPQDAERHFDGLIRAGVLVPVNGR